MSSAIRFSGLASGMDTEAIIKKMMEPYQTKLDNMQKEKKLLEMKQEVWKDVNKKVYDFWKKELGDLRLTSTMLQRKGVSSDSNKVSVSEVNSKASKGNHVVEVTQLARSAMFASGVDVNKDDEIVSADINNAMSVQYNGKTYSIDLKAGDTTASVISKLNQQFVSNGNELKAVYDEGAKRIFINANNVVDNSQIQLGAANVDIANKLGFGDATKNVAHKGQKAIYKYDGVELYSDSNEVTVSGIKMELKSITGPVNISVTNDTEKVYEKVKSFVTKYNELITDLNERYGAKRNKDYKPLLADEKKAMSENEIKLWNEKINKSILRRDGIIKGILTSMRDTLGRDANAIKADGAPNIDDDYNYLFKMGIVTGDWKEKGLLHIQGDEDEDAEYSEKTNKLKELIEKDPEKLIEALSTFGKNIYSNIQEKMGKTKYSSAFTLYNDVTLKEDIEDYEDKYKALQKKVLAIENRYYKQFAQMEKVIQNSNTQGQYLQSQIAGM